MHDETETNYSPLASLTINSAPHRLIEQLCEYARSREPGRRCLIEKLGRTQPSKLPTATMTHSHTNSHTLLQILSVTLFEKMPIVRTS